MLKTKYLLAPKDYTISVLISSLGLSLDIVRLTALRRQAQKENGSQHYSPNDQERTSELACCRYLQIALDVGLGFFPELES